MADAPNAAATAQESKGQLVLTGPAYTKSVFGIVVPKGSDQLAKAIQAALQKIMDDGTYLGILKKYGQENNAITTATINGGVTD
jgi:polar amino acid transport system substrate-binding protein